MRYKATLETGTRLQRLAAALSGRVGYLDTTATAVEEQIETLRSQVRRSLSAEIFTTTHISLLRWTPTQIELTLTLITRASIQLGSIP